MELLAPAGSEEAFLAAISNGADAVYLGGKNYSARQSAKNFTDQQLEDAVNFAHLRDKKIYIAINTLISQEEFKPLLDYVWKLYQMGVDAIIVQDLGLMAAVRKVFPDLRIHASTQMSVHNSATAQFLNGQGIKRIVLARELGRDEVESICRDVPDLEFEVFIHGALCYSYSGQCLFSSMLGGRSGNRGKCAQPCRLPYTLCSNNSRIKNIESAKYLLSPADLCLIEELANMQASGVNSLKIEGRMKRPEYVAVVTGAYREALDLLASNSEKAISRETLRRLMKIFNRNFTKGYYGGDKTTFMSVDRPDNRGVLIGQVLKQDREYLTAIALDDRVRLGDGLEIEGCPGPGMALLINKMKVMGKEAAEAGPGEIISLELAGKAASGDRVYKTHDAKLLESAVESIKRAKASKIPVDAEAYLHEGEPLQIIFIDEKGNRGQAESRSPAQPAVNYALDYEVLREKIDKLGNTPFALRSFNCFGDSNLIIPFSEINDTRRRASEELLRLCLTAYQHPQLDKNEFLLRRKQCLGLRSSRNSGIKQKTLLSVAISGVREAYAALEAGAGRVYLHLEGIAGKKRPGLDEIRELLEQGRLKGCEVVLALPRIQKPGDLSCQDYLNSKPDSVIAGNLGSLHNCLQEGIKVRGDYSLNIFNPLAVEYLLRQGTAGVCLSPELNFRQLQSFNNLDKVEMLVHGEVILMTSEFCILKGILGSEQSQCPAYCRQGSYFLQDQKGYQFPIVTDADCRFYLLNSRTLCLIEELERILLLRPESIRVEALRSGEEEIVELVNIYLEAMDSINTGHKADLALCKQKLAQVSPSPFTRGHFYRGVM